MNGYTISEREMQDLVACGRESTSFFAAAGLAFGLSAAVLVMDLATLNGTPITPSNWFWLGVGAMLLVVSILLAIKGYLKHKEGSVRLREIKEQTDHDDE